MNDMSITTAQPHRIDASARETQMREAAQALEATFLSEMLKGAGLGAMEGAFGGGTGEEQFSSFLRQQQADSMAAAGGIGLAEHIFKSLARESRNDA